jgi:long-chain fatty acid transport protein
LYEHVFLNNASINAAHSPTLDMLTGYSEDYGNLLSLSAPY